jgi:hypothetical protein
VACAIAHCPKSHSNTEVAGNVFFINKLKALHGLTPQLWMKKKRRPAVLTKFGGQGRERKARSGTPRPTLAC